MRKNIILIISILFIVSCQNSVERKRKMEKAKNFYISKGGEFSAGRLDKDANVLSLENTKIKDSDLKYLKDIKKLIALDLRDTKITDKGLKYLSDINLKWLDLTNTRITNKGLKNIQKINCSYSY